MAALIVPPPRRVDLQPFPPFPPPSSPHTLSIRFCVIGVPESSTLFVLSYIFGVSIGGLLHEDPLHSSSTLS